MSATPPPPPAPIGGPANDPDDLAAKIDADAIIAEAIDDDADAQRELERSRVGSHSVLTGEAFDCLNMTDAQEAYFDERAAEIDAGVHVPDAGAAPDDDGMTEEERTTYDRWAEEHRKRMADGDPAETKRREEAELQEAADMCHRMNAAIVRALKRQNDRETDRERTFDRIMGKVRVVDGPPEAAETIPSPGGAVAAGFNPDDPIQCSRHWNLLGRGGISPMDFSVRTDAEHWSRLTRLFVDANPAETDSTEKRLQSCEITDLLIQEPRGEDSFRAMCRMNLTMCGTLPCTLVRRPGKCQTLNRAAWGVYDRLLKDRNPFKLVVITCYPKMAVGEAQPPLHLKGVPEDDTGNDGHYVILFTAHSPSTARVMDLCNGHRDSMLQQRFHSLTEYLERHIQSFEGDVGSVRLGETNTGNKWCGWVDIDKQGNLGKDEW